MLFYQDYFDEGTFHIIVKKGQCKLGDDIEFGPQKDEHPITRLLCKDSYFL